MAQQAPPSPSLRRPRWGHTTSLFQARMPAFWLYAVLVGLTGLLLWAEQSAFRRISPSGWLLSWVLLALYAVPVFLLILYLDLYEREPMSLVIGALLWGAVAAPLLSGIGNVGWGVVVVRLGGADFASRWSAALTAPFVEETLKVLGVILIYLIARDEIDDVMDGFVYGAMVGLGFTVVEDVFYFMGVFGGSTGGVLVGFFLRVVASGLYGHVLYTGLTGMGVAYFVTRRHEAPFGKRFAVAAGLFAVAVFGHFLWNSPLLDFFPEPPWTGGEWLLIPLATAVKGIPLLAFAVVAVSLARRREVRWLGAALGSEVGTPGLTAEELEALRSPASRRRSVRAMRRRAGPQAAVLLKRLHTQQVNLAMVRTRVEADDHPDLVRQREYCRSLRDALRSMPGAAPAETAPPAPAPGPPGE